MLLTLWTAQFFGGMAALSSLYLIRGEWSDLKVLDVPVIMPTSIAGYDPQYTYQVLLNEIVCTFIFVFMVLHVKGKNTSPSPIGVNGALVVALTLYAVIYAGTAFGACYNPAIGASFAFLDFLMKKNGVYVYAYWYMYILGPFIGGALAGFVHWVHESCHAKEKEDND